LDEEKNKTSEQTVTRRDFLVSGAMATSLAAVGVVGGSFGWQFIYPATAKIPTVQVLATSLSKLAPGTRLVMKLGGNEVVLVNKNGTVRAISTVCTHLGCRAAWDEGRQQFVCPCHTGIFDADGKVVSGPQPRALDEFAVEIKSGNVYVAVPQKEGAG
jgi:cytochrome b6-f complex iron-sulfur subunit